MATTRTAPVLVSLLLLMGACGTTGDAPTPSAGETSPGVEEGDDLATVESPAPGKKEKRAGGSGKREKTGSKGIREDSGSGGAGEGGVGETGSGGGERADGSRSGSRGAAPAGGGGVAFPTPGTYVYTQKGYEEFCSTGCERYRLPPRQRIVSSLSARSSQSAVVVTKARASGDRLARTTTRYEEDAASILEVHLEYSYEGFDFARTYRPDPPVAALRFPLAAGRSWSGKWKGDVSGSYSVAVGGRETLAGREVVRLSTSTRFSGDIEGESHVTLWVAPGDGTVVGSAGNMTAEMGIGTYRTGFETRLALSP